MAQQGQFYILYPPSEARPLGGWGTVSRDRAEKAEAEGGVGYYGPQPPDLSQILELSGGWDVEHRSTIGDVFDITTQLADEGVFVGGQFEGEDTWNENMYGGRKDVVDRWQGGYGMPAPPSEDDLPEGAEQATDQYGQKRWIPDPYTNRWTPNPNFGTPVQESETVVTDPITGEPVTPEGTPAETSPTVATSDGLTNADGEESAKGILTRLIKAYGLPISLVDFMSDEIIEGTSEIGIIQKLREREEYKTRFPGMAKRTTAGFNAINETTYLELEDGYRAALIAAKLPATFYDTEADFAELIGGDVSASEFQRRVNLAYEAAGAADPETLNQLEELYGVDQPQLAAIYLDPTRAKDIVQHEREFRTAQMSAGVVRALGSGLSKTAAERLEKAAVRTSDMAKLAGSRGLTSSLLGESGLTTDQIALGTLGMDSGSTQQIESTIENRRARLAGRSGMFADQGGFKSLGTTGT
tara:strand:- start:2658 stop:4067 length:1410 start_codon:yes stop_codon:yes gene_type:complete